MSTLNKFRDWSIKGFQLQKTYLDDWEDMKLIFHRYGLDINIHGPLLTLAEAKNVKFAKSITDGLSNELGITNKKELFVTILRTFTKYARIHAEKRFTSFVKENILDLIEVARNGSLKDSDESLEREVRRIINGK